MKIIPLLTQCREATKSGNAAALLYRILFWMPKATVTHGGRKLIANSAVQWCQETGLTYDQYRRAMAQLRKLGLVETEQHLFAGKNVTHVRTTALADQIRIGACLGSSHNAPVKLDKTATPELSKNAQLLLHGASSLECPKGETTIALASAHAKFGIQKEKVDTGKKTLYETLKAKKNNGPVEKSTSPTVSSSGGKLNSTEAVEDLAKAWEKIVGDVYGHYVPPWTKKRLGQLRDFSDLCPPGHAKEILEVCLQKWSDFIFDAKLFYAAYPIPERPRIEFLLKYIDAATNFGMKQKPKSNWP